MAGDLEDFLRRAAQRRQAKAAQNRGVQDRGAQGMPGAARPVNKSRPEYSNRKTERLAAEDEVLTAELVEDHEDSIAVRMQRLEAAKKAAAKAEAELAQKKGKHATSASAYEVHSSVAFSGNPAQDLIKLLRNPGGIKQAVLLKEILDRPEHRW